MKAMILAAGRGERLRPLTDATPKPLLEIAGETLLGRHLERLARAGFTRAVINVSHLAERITTRFGDGTRCGLGIDWSHEAEPLESAGGIAQARALLGPAPFLLLNADIYNRGALVPRKYADACGRKRSQTIAPKRMACTSSSNGE